MRKVKFKQGTNNRLDSRWKLTEWENDRVVIVCHPEDLFFGIDINMISLTQVSASESFFQLRR
jgi:alpha/beta superfamily hydrolase